MRSWILFSFLIPLTQLIGNITWSSPTTLFSSSGVTLASPQITIDPTTSEADAIWLANSGTSSLYTSSFDGSSWSTPTLLTSSTNQLSPQLKRDISGSLVTAWNNYDGTNWSLFAMVKSWGSWSAPTLLQNISVDGANSCLCLSSSPQGGIGASWLDMDQRVHGITWNEGNFSAPYYLSEEGMIATRSASDFGCAVFLTDVALYATFFDLLNPSANPTSAIAFPRPVLAPALSISMDQQTNCTLFSAQDQKSQVLIGGLSQDNINWKYNTFCLPYENVQEVRLILDCIVADQGAGIWLLADGSIQAGYFVQGRWTHVTQLTAHGADPAIAFNVITQNPVAIWADLTAGGNNNTIMTSEFNINTWTTPVSISAGGYSVSAPQIQVNSKGQACAIWIRQATSSSTPVLETSYGN